MGEISGNKLREWLEKKINEPDVFMEEQEAFKEVLEALENGEFDPDPWEFNDPPKDY